MHRQLTFELPHVPSLDGDDFFVSGSNEQAVKLVNSWPNWSNPINIVAGPSGSGKTHLVNVWRAHSGATCFSAHNMEDAVALASENAIPIAIEDIDHSAFNENAAFHLLNLAREQRFDVLITARNAPGTWTIALPDLRSRLRSAALVNIGEPDEALLRAVLVKLFTDRQLSITPDVIDYLIPRMERSMAAAQSVVESLDKAALAEKRAVTRPLAGKIMTTSMPKDAKGETC